MRPTDQKKRTRAQGWFLTYPKCDLSPKEALDKLHETGKLVEFVVAQEKHQDGTNHIHAFIKYEKKVEWKEDRWDLGTYHGNYQKAKCWRAVIAYV